MIKASVGFYFSTLLSPDVHRCLRNSAGYAAEFLAKSKLSRNKLLIRSVLMFFFLCHVASLFLQYRSIEGSARNFADCGIDFCFRGCKVSRGLRIGGWVYLTLDLTRTSHKSVMAIKHQRRFCSPHLRRLSRLMDALTRARWLNHLLLCCKDAASVNIWFRKSSTKHFDLIGADSIFDPDRKMLFRFN